MDSPPPIKMGTRKRPRIDATAESSSRGGDGDENSLRVKAEEMANSEDFKRHEHLWFLDGSVVLIAENVGFRVYAGILSCDSAVFRNLLNASTERMNGCPVLRLPDAPKELAIFLAFLYARTEIMGIDTKKLKFAAVSSLIRLGLKYEIARLHKDGLERLKTCFPSKWSHENWSALVLGESDVMTFEPKDAITAVALARLTNTDSILPTAFYRVIALSPDDVPYEDLSFGDMIRCLKGKDKLLAAKTASSAWVFACRTCSPSCLSQTSCKGIIRSLPEKAHRLQSLTTYLALNPIIPASSDLRLCFHCLAMIQAKDWQARGELFSNLPSCFDMTVDGWTG